MLVAGNHDGYRGWIWRLPLGGVQLGGGLKVGGDPMLGDLGPRLPLANSMTHRGHSVRT